MKTIFTLISLLLPALLFAQNIETIQKGKTVEYQGKNAKTPLANVSIEIGAVEDVSKEDGSFQLVFHSLRPGDRIPKGRIKKSGFEVFNSQALEEWRISQNNEPFTVVLCRSDRFRELVEKYYNVSNKSYKEQFEKEKGKYAQLLKEKKLSEEEYNTKLKESHEQLIQLQERLDEHANMMARIDENLLSEIEQKAIDLAQEGKIDEGIKLLESLQIGKELKKAAQKRDQSQQQVDEAKEDITALIPKAKTAIKLYQSMGGKENLDKCCQLYMDIALADTTNFENVFECAHFLHDQNRFIDAEHFYLIASNLPVKENQKGSILNNLGNLHSNLNNYPQAEKEYNEALSIRRKLAETNPDVYLPDVAMSLNNLGILHSDLNNYPQAEKEYNEALEIYRKLAETNPDVYLPYVARSLNNLGDLYGAQKLYKKAIACYEELENSFKKIFQNNQIAPICGSISYYYLLLSEFSKSKEYAEKGLSFDPSQKWINTNLITALLFLGEYEKAEQITKEIMNEEWNGKKLKEFILEDFAEFEQAGIIPENAQSNVNKLKELLAK